MHFAVSMAQHQVNLHCISKKNEPTLASCSFDKHGLILITLGKQHQHTYRNYKHNLLSLSCYLICF